MKSTNPKFVTVPLNDLKPYKNNPRKHPKEQIDLIACSMKELGFLIPITIDENNNIITGHARLEAARQIEITDIPCILHSHLSAKEKRAFRMFDNKISELSTWDPNLLALEFEFLLQCNFDLSMTGFSTAEIDLFLTQKITDDEYEQNTIHGLDADTPFITQQGDIWCLGNHKIYCGDALSPESYKILMWK